MSVVWSAEGAQERDVLLKLGQGRAVSKGLLNLACVYFFGSHGYHLRRAALAAAPCAWWRGLAAGTSPYVTGLAQPVPAGCIETVISLLLVDFRRLVRTSATRRVTS